MLKYAKIINEETKQCEVGIGTNGAFYNSIGMTLQEVEEAYDGLWYLSGFAPSAPEPSYAEKRAAEYPPMADQLDMQYWDAVNGTNIWKDTIAGIKEKYPKPLEERETVETPQSESAGV